MVVRISKSAVVLDFRVRLIAEVTIRSALGYSRRALNQTLIELFSIVKNALAALAYKKPDRPPASRIKEALIEPRNRSAGGTASLWSHLRS
jgi:hypothetical protein